MSDDIRNAGLKAWIFAGFFILVIAFLAMWAYIYNINLDYLPQ